MLPMQCQMGEQTIFRGRIYLRLEKMIGRIIQIIPDSERKHYFSSTKPGYDYFNIRPLWEDNLPSRKVKIAAFIAVFALLLFLMLLAFSSLFELAPEYDDLVLVLTLVSLAICFGIGFTYRFMEESELKGWEWYFDGPIPIKVGHNYEENQIVRISYLNGEFLLDIVNHDPLTKEKNVRR